MGTPPLEVFEQVQGEQVAEVWQMTFEDQMIGLTRPLEPVLVPRWKPPAEWMRRWPGVRPPAAASS